MERRYSLQAALVALGMSASSLRAPQIRPPQTKPHPALGEHLDADGHSGSQSMRGDLQSDSILQGGSVHQQSLTVPTAEGGGRFDRGGGTATVLPNCENDCCQGGKKLTGNSTTLSEGPCTLQRHIVPRRSVQGPSLSDSACNQPHS
ncbi:hypothetical protein Efla_000446 [Eimeria flavescens]